jgi:hypothetical protein
LLVVIFRLIQGLLSGGGSLLNFINSPPPANPEFYGGRLLTGQYSLFHNAPGSGYLPFVAGAMPVPVSGIAPFTPSSAAAALKIHQSAFL